MTNVINSIKAIIILQVDGRRRVAKYYDEQLNKDSKGFERRLFAKTKNPKAKDEIIVLDGVLVVHKFMTDSHLYVVGGRNENPLVLDSLLNCLVEITDGKLSSNNSSNDGLQLDDLSRVILALDEVCDSGMILETDPNLVLQRITSASNSDDFESKALRTARGFFGLD